jgi:LytR cell envelope-related transcriptional attenuator
VEHAQPLNRAFPWRLTALVASAVALTILAGLVLTHKSGQAQPTAAARRHAPTLFAVPLRSRAQISVVVLNGNGVSGVAGQVATTVLARGYRHAIPTDAQNMAYARSLVLYRPGWQREAERLSRDVKIPAVAPLDGRVAPEYASVPLVVILGSK